MDKLKEFLKTNRKTISPVVSLIFSFFVAYFIEFYKLLGPNNYFGIPIVLVLLLTGISIGLAMTTTIHNQETNPDATTVEIPIHVESKAKSEFKEMKGFFFKITQILEGHCQIEPSVYCPVCKVEMTESKTFFGKYKFECIICEKTLTSKYSKRQMMGVMKTIIQNS